MPTAITLPEQYTPRTANRKLTKIWKRYRTIREMLFPLVTAQRLELLLSNPEATLQNPVPAYDTNLGSWALSS